MPVDAKKENEEKKKYLWGYQRAKRHLIRLEEELAGVRMGKICPSVIQDGMPKASGGSDLSAYMSQVDDLERKLVKARYKQIRKLKEIRDRIEWLEDDSEKDVLVYRYLRGMKWEDICVKMGYSWKQVHRFHSNGLKNFKMT